MKRTTLKDLSTFEYALEQRDEANKVEEIPFDKIEFNRPNTNFEGGQKVEIHMTNGGGDDFIDFGYLFALPFNAIDEGDLFVHITHTSKLEEFDEEWSHLCWLLNLSRVTKILIIPIESD